MNLDDWTADPCRECGATHGQLWMTGLITRAEYADEYDRMAHPWKRADAPNISCSPAPAE